MTFKEAYKFPLIWDDTYVWTSDRNMAFQFLNRVISDNFIPVNIGSQKEIIKAINGEKTALRPLDLTYNQDQSMIELEGKQFISIRGWGHLTGSGGLRLPEDEACRIQDEFAQYIIDQLK